MGDVDLEMDNVWTSGRTTSGSLQVTLRFLSQYNRWAISKNVYSILSV